MKRHGLFIGLNAVNPDNYDGWNGLLSCAENDAVKMSERFEKVGGIEAVKLIGKDATIQNVTENLVAMLKSDAEEIVFMFSGHGTTIKTHTAIALYDGLFFDLQLHKLLASAKEKIKILIFDSCHAGGMEKDVLVASKAMPKPIASYLTGALEKYMASYLTGALEKYMAKSRSLTLAACKPDETASDGEAGTNGLFTTGLLQEAGVSVAVHMHDAQIGCGEDQHPIILSNGLKKPEMAAILNGRYF
jgi:Caspase domain